MLTSFPFSATCTQKAKIWSWGNIRDVLHPRTTLSTLCFGTEKGGKTITCLSELFGRGKQVSLCSHLCSLGRDWGGDGKVKTDPWFKARRMVWWLNELGASLSAHTDTEHYAEGSMLVPQFPHCKVVTVLPTPIPGLLIKHSWIKAQICSVEQPRHQLLHGHTAGKELSLALLREQEYCPNPVTPFPGPAVQQDQQKGTLADLSRWSTMQDKLSFPLLDNKILDLLMNVEALTKPILAIKKAPDCLLGIFKECIRLQGPKHNTTCWPWIGYSPAKTLLHYSYGILQKTFYKPVSEFYDMSI